MENLSTAKGNTSFPSEYYMNLWDKESNYEFEFDDDYTPIDPKVFAETPNFSDENKDPLNTMFLFKTNDDLQTGTLKHAVSTDMKQGEVTQITNARDTSEVVKTNKTKCVCQQRSSSPKSEEEKENDSDDEGEYLPCIIKTTSQTPTLLQNQSEKEIRWGRAMDKLLFTTIRERVKAGQLDLQKILSMRITYNDTNIPEVIELAERFNWKGLHKYFVKRIQNLCKRSKMSVREAKLLRKIVRRDYTNKPVNFDEIIYNFPGKTVEILKSTFDSFSFTTELEY